MRVVVLLDRACTDALLTAALKYLKYDPNFADDMDEDGSEEEEQEEEEGSEEEYSDDDGGWGR